MHAVNHVSTQCQNIKGSCRHREAWAVRAPPAPTLGSVCLRPPACEACQFSTTPWTCRALEKGVHFSLLVRPLGVGGKHAPRPHPKGLHVGPRDSGSISQPVGAEIPGGQGRSLYMIAALCPVQPRASWTRGGLLFQHSLRNAGEARWPCQTGHSVLWDWGTARFSKLKHRTPSLL